VCAALVFLVTPRAPAQPNLPSDSLFWISVQKTDGLDDPAAALLGESLTRAMTGLLGDEETAQFMGRLAAEATRAHTPWSLCIMEYAAEQTPRARTIERLTAYFHAETSDASSFAAALPRPPGGTQTTPVTRDLTATAYDRGQPWQRIEWLQQPSSLTVGFGEGSLQQAWGDPAVGPVPWTPARQVLGGHDAGVLRLWLNLNQLRRAMPDHFTATPVGRALAACGAANGRGLFFRVTHADGPPHDPVVYTADLAWSARSDPPSFAHRVQLSETTWPDDLQYPDGAAWAVAVRANWGDWTEAALDARQNSGDDREQRARQARRNAWIAERGGALAGLIRMSAPWVVICGGERGLELRCDFTRDADRFHAYARGVFGFLGLPRFDPVARVWRCPVGDSGLEWGIQGHALVARPLNRPPVNPR
jgi:hypothetical protein